MGAGARITVAIPVHIIDAEKSPGIKRGGIVNLVRHEIELYCNADDIPEKIDVSLDGLEIGGSVHIRSVKLPPGTKPTIARDFTVATVAAPTVVREELAADPWAPNGMLRPVSIERWTVLLDGRPGP